MSKIVKNINRRQRRNQLTKSLESSNRKEIFLLIFMRFNLFVCFDLNSRQNSFFSTQIFEVKEKNDMNRDDEMYIINDDELNFCCEEENEIEKTDHHSWRTLIF